MYSVWYKHTLVMLCQEADCLELLAAMLPNWHTRPAQTCKNMPGGGLIQACLRQGGAFCKGALRGLGVKGLPVCRGEGTRGEGTGHD